MGSEESGAPADEHGRVRGTANLRVVDASLFPQVTYGNLNAPVIMVAEKLSDVILGRAPLARADHLSPWRDPAWRDRHRERAPVVCGM